MGRQFGWASRNPESTALELLKAAPALFIATDALIDAIKFKP
jgi:hypothetical protein